jgi:hypothetical protein
MQRGMSVRAAPQGSAGAAGVSGCRRSDRFMPPPLPRSRLQRRELPAPRGELPPLPRSRLQRRELAAPLMGSLAPVRSTVQAICSSVNLCDADLCRSVVFCRFRSKDPTKSNSFPRCAMSTAVTIVAQQRAGSRSRSVVYSVTHQLFTHTYLLIPGTRPSARYHTPSFTRNTHPMCEAVARS